jgi:UDP-N-acetylglucosamine acyltransferase
MAVHPTAIIMGDVQLAEDVEVGAYAVIRGPITIGKGTIIEERASVSGPAEIGCDNKIGCGAVVGGDPQDLSYHGQHSFLRVGNRNTIREYATIHRGWKEGSASIIGNDNMIMGLAHLGHDCIVHNQCVIANGSLLAGHVVLFDRAFVSGQVVIHQFARIGRCAMVGGLSRVTKDIPPFMTVVGESSILGLNVVGMRRAGITPQARMALRNAFRVIYRSPLLLNEALGELSRDPGAPEVMELVEFVRQSKRGICWYRRVPLSSSHGGGEDD